MDRQIRRVGFVLLIAFVAVFLQLNYVQIFAAQDIAAKPANIRRLLAEYSIKRGDIVTLDGTTLATSRRTDNRLEYRRDYPEGDLYGHVTGFYSLVFGTARIEQTYNDQLLGESGVITMQDIEDRLFGSGEQGDDVRLTVVHTLQQVARQQLGDQQGAVVALDPSTGEVRAMWSNPSYDPGPLGSHKPRRIRRYWRSLNPNSPTSPLVSKTTSRGYPPGSTFKIVTAAAALQSGRYDPGSTFPDPVELELPQTTSTIKNFSGGTCTGGGQIDLETALVVSCNTTFGRIGLQIPGPVRDTAEAFGLNSELPFDVGTETSLFPEISEEEKPARAQAAIGQFSVVTTPLQMALIAATVANDGNVPRPRLVREVISPSGGIIRRFSPETLGRAVDEDVADTLTSMMVKVVEEGTGQAARMEGTAVAGKTGTAQTVEGASPHAWFVAFAPAQNPQLAVAVLVENGGSLGSEATGGAVAAPIAKAVLEADRELRGW